jgi:hypothetical protein
MPYMLREFTCPECGKLFTRRAAEAYGGSCVPCNVARSAANALGIHQQAGPWFEKWAAGMERAARAARQIADIGAEIDSIGM